MNPEQNYSPGEIGLGRLVNFDKGDFVGRLALEREAKAGGPERRLVGLQLDWYDIEGLYDAQGLPPAISPSVGREPVEILFWNQRFLWISRVSAAYPSRIFRVVRPLARCIQYPRTEMIGWCPTRLPVLAPSLPAHGSSGTRARRKGWSSATDLHGPGRP